MTFNGGGGNYPTQGTSQAPPSPLKQFKNGNYCHTHGGDIHNTHTSATCAQPGKNHQQAAITTRGYTKPYSQVPLANALRLHALPFNQPLHPHLLNAVWQQRTLVSHCPQQLGLWPACSCLPMRQQHSSSPTRNVHDGEYHEFNNGFNYLGTMPALAPPPAYGQPQPAPPGFYQNHF